MIKPDNWLQKISLAIVEYAHFDSLIMFFIILNTIVLAGVDINNSQIFLKTQKISEFVFLVIFAIECVLKLIAYRKVYFYENWNVFDFVIVCGSVIGLFFENFLGGVTVVRILRIGRVFRLLKKAKRLYAILNSFIHTIPTFVNVFSLIIIMIYIFAVIGNRLFAHVKIHGSLDTHINF